MENSSDKILEKDYRDTYLAIIIEEIFTQRGDLKEKYISMRENFYFTVIEKKLVSLHASFHCDVVGAHNFSMAKKELVETHNTSICDTAPYPECNGANGCDTCEHQEED